MQVGSEAGVVLLQVHEGLLSSEGLLTALLHQALHAAQGIAPICHAALQRLRFSNSSALTHCESLDTLSLLS